MPKIEPMLKQKKTIEEQLFFFFFLVLITSQDNQYLMNHPMDQNTPHICPENWSANGSSISIHSFILLVLLLQLRWYFHFLPMPSHKLYKKIWAYWWTIHWLEHLISSDHHRSYWMNPPNRTCPSRKKETSLRQHMQFNCTYNFAIPAFRTAAAQALIAVSNALSKMVNSPDEPGYLFFWSST